MKIRWIGQSGYLLSDGRTEICIDPYLSDSVEKAAGHKRLVEIPIRPEDLKPEAVFCTHGHLDHLDPDTIGRMERSGRTFYAPTDCMAELERLGAENRAAFDVGDRAAVGAFQCEAVFADHTAPGAIGIVVRACGKTLYFSGDTYYNQRLKALADCGVDVMFVCINGRLGNMDVDEAALLTKKVAPKVGVPNHYGMFADNTEDPTKYAAQVANSFIMEFDREYEIEELMKSR